MAKPLSEETFGSAAPGFQVAGDADRVVAARTAEVESAVLKSWEDHLAPQFPRDLAVVATAALGRRELFPCSDVDLLLLVNREPESEAARNALSAFLASLWDRGMRVSHSVRTPADCCQLHPHNLELIVSLFDARFLAGDAGLFEPFRLRLASFVASHREWLAQGLCRMARQRHARFHDTIYHLEPDIKESPGGLRDLHLVRWLTQLETADKTRIPAPERPPSLEPARHLLWTLRCYLHFRASRDYNRLDFEAQQGLSEQPFSRGRDPAAWMREYFRHARVVFRAAVEALEAVESRSSPLLSSFQAWRSRLSNADFSVRRERIYFRAPAAQMQDPERMLGLFEFAARHGFRPSWEAERQIRERLNALRDWALRGRALWPWFRTVCSLPHAPVALRAMHETGVLGTLFPEWQQIESLVIWDWYHRYTVDEHTLVSIEALAALRQPREGLLRHFSQLVEEAGDPAPLICALLFHDTGKASRGAPHPLESARLARQALRRIAAPEEICERVGWLIEQHLSLSEVMCTRDPDDPSTAACVAQRVGTLEALRQLTLLTYADITAVNPEAMTPWRLQQLWRLYLVTYKELTRELEADRIGPSSEQFPEMASFLEGLPVRYLRTHSPAAVEQHFRLYQQALRQGVALSLERREDLYCLTVITRDRPFLLASLAGALSGFGMNVLKAEAFSNQQAMVLDTFVFEDPNRTLELNPSEKERFHRVVARAALGQLRPGDLPAHRGGQPHRRGRAISPSVTFDSETSRSATLLEVVAEDRPGLLYDLATVISSHGCNIELVLLDTQARKALDVFYITKDGRKLEPDLEAALREQLLEVCRG